MSAIDEMKSKKRLDRETSINETKYLSQSSSPGNLINMKFHVKLSFIIFA